jgi:hypothetical protein
MATSGIGPASGTGDYQFASEGLTLPTSSASERIAREAKSEGLRSRRCHCGREPGESTEDGSEVLPLASAKGDVCVCDTVSRQKGSPP